MNNDRLVPVIVVILTAIAVFGIMIHGEITTDKNRFLITPLGVLNGTITDEAFSYPNNPPNINVKFVEMLPHAETGWHTHDTPIIATILHGKLTVNYCMDDTVYVIDVCNDILVKHYTTGDTFVEAINTQHNGINEGVIPVKIHIVTLE